MMQQKRMTHPALCLQNFLQEHGMYEFEVNTGNTDDFQYEFTFTNYTSFEFHDLRTNKPIYDINGYNGAFDYANRHISGDGYIDGEILTDDSLRFTYYYGTSGGSYTVTLTLTR